MNEVRRYRTEDGREVVTEWLADLKDIRARARIAARIDRLAAGNFGDRKAIRDGVSEPRVDYGPGYRVYYGKLGKTILLLLCGGEKRSQDAGIERAAAWLKDFKSRSRP